ncbi:MAG: LCP family protein [Candidatus Daviesbacteria bacterium]|nr:LCP family protein [Candidatus Daviesbacteria bacterium]
MDNLRPLRLGKSGKDNPLKVRRVRQAIKKLLPVLIVVGILISLAIFLTTLSGTSSYVSSIISGTALKSTDGRVNILLLGIAGGTHEGPTLTDTIMVASYNLKTDQVHLFSIPRDLWLPSFKSKVNAVYEIGLSQGSGLGLSKTVMGNILGLPVHYVLRVDFRGFVQTIDTIDGIDTVVEKSFDDYLYPIQGKEDDLCGNSEKEIEFSEEEAKKLNIDPGKRKVLINPEGQIATDAAEEDKGVKYFSCRYEHISFSQGKMHMNGAVALAFVRSRHGTNGEASDFARSKRQQKVIEAVRSKLLSLETLSSPQKVSDLVKTLGKSIDTDISIKDALEFYKLSRKIGKIHSFVLDASPKSGLSDNITSLLINPPRDEYGGAYVLISQDDDFSIVQGYVKKILEGIVTEYEATGAARIGN